MRHGFELTSSQPQFSDTEILSESLWVCRAIQGGSLQSKDNCMQTGYANRPVLLKLPILVLFLQEKKFQVDFRKGGPGLKAGYLAGVGLLHNVNGALGGTARLGVAKAAAPEAPRQGGASEGPAEAQVRCRGCRQRALAAPRPPLSASRRAAGRSDWLSRDSRAARASGQHGGFAVAAQAGSFPLHVAACPQDSDTARPQPSAPPPARDPAVVRPEAPAAAAAAGPGSRRGLAGEQLPGVARGDPEAQDRDPQPGSGRSHRPEWPREPPHPAGAAGRPGPRVGAAAARAGGSSRRSRSPGTWELGEDPAPSAASPAAGRAHSSWRWC